MFGLIVAGCVTIVIVYAFVQIACWLHGLDMDDFT